MPLKPILEKQFLVLIDQLKESYWNKATAPKETREVAEYNDGQTGVTRKVLGFTSLDNVTLTKPFDPVQDKFVIDWYTDYRKNIATKDRFTVSIQPVQNDYQGNTIKGVTITLTGCQIVSFKAPGVDRQGTATAMIELELCYDDLSFS